MSPTTDTDIPVSIPDTQPSGPRVQVWTTERSRSLDLPDVVPPSSQMSENETSRGPHGTYICDTQLSSGYHPGSASGVPEGGNPYSYASQPSADHDVEAPTQSVSHPYPSISATNTTRKNRARRFFSRLSGRMAGSKVGKLASKAWKKCTTRAPDGCPSSAATQASLGLHGANPSASVPQSDAAPSGATPQEGISGPLASNAPPAVISFTSVVCNEPDTQVHELPAHPPRRWEPTSAGSGLPKSTKAVTTGRPIVPKMNKPWIFPARGDREPWLDDFHNYVSGRPISQHSKRSSNQSFKTARSSAAPSE